MIQGLSWGSESSQSCLPFRFTFSLYLALSRPFCLLYPPNTVSVLSLSLSLLLSLSLSLPPPLSLDLLRSLLKTRLSIQASLCLLFGVLMGVRVKSRGTRCGRCYGKGLLSPLKVREDSPEPPPYSTNPGSSLFVGNPLPAGPGEVTTQPKTLPLMIPGEIAQETPDNLAPLPVTTLFSQKRAKQGRATCA